MTLRLVWTPHARRQLREIRAYIRQSSLWQADRVVEAIVVEAGLIPTHPRAATICPELDDETLRHRVVLRRRIIYRIHPDRIVIVAVIHERQLFDASIMGRS